MAVSINKNNEDCAVHDVDEETEVLELPEEYRQDSPKGIAGRWVFISLRDYEKEERHLIEKHDTKVITTKEVRNKGTEIVVRSVLRYLAWTGSTSIFPLM